jgi:hypothetical protein
MSATEGLLLEDPEGSKIMLTRIDDAVFTVAAELAPGAVAFRMFEENRAKLRSFLKTLDG